MARNTSDTPRSRALGAELRRLRKERTTGSLREFAKQVGVTPTALSRWETGKVPPDSEQVGVLLGALGVVGDEQERLLEDARAALDPTWVAPGVDRQLSALLDFEKTATRIVDVSPLLIPGLIQTEDYAQAIMDDGTLAAGEMRSAVTMRMGRQQALTRATPVHLTALIGQPALRRPIGGWPVMLEQLRHLLKLNELPNVEIKALPDGTDYDPSLAGPFVLYEFALGAPIVHFEHHRSSMFLPDKKDVEDMRIAAGRITELAMSAEDTSELVADVINNKETT